jgi:hypothetical protein
MKISKEITEIRKFESLYGKAILKFGFTQVPNLLIRHMKELKLRGVDVIFLTHLLSHEFSFENGFRVWPSMKTMSVVTGIAYGTLNESKKRLVKNGFIKIVNERNKYRTNTYDLLPLRMQLDAYAKRKILLDDKVDEKTLNETMEDKTVQNLKEFFGDIAPISEEGDIPPLDTNKTNI